MKLKTYFLNHKNKIVQVIILIFISISINAQTIEEWYSSAQQRIDTLRKGDFGFKIIDKNGQSYSGPVSVRMVKHEFPFGIAFDLYEGAVFNGNVYSITAPISATADAEIYQSERWYSFISYEIPVEIGKNYNLTLKFAEIYFNNSDARIFDVAVEGTKFLSNFDMFTAAGGNNIAVDTTINITATDSLINIELVAKVDNAVIKGIEIQTIEGDWITRINCGGGALTTSDGNYYESDENFFDQNAARYPTEEQWMKAAMQKYFNYGVSGNSFKWSGIQPQHTAPDYTAFDNAVKWTQSIGWELRAHTLLWGGDDDHSMPGWVRNLPTPEAITDTCKMRVIREMTRYKSIVKEYDVINEPLTNHADHLQNTVGDSINWNCFKWARSADPDAELYINDYNVEYNWGQAKEYRDLILKILEMGGSVTGAGMQAHFWENMRPNLTEFVTNINIVAEAGLPIKLTEFDNGPLNQQDQADDLAMVLKIAFSHPSINGIVSWSLRDGNVWREGTGIFEENRKPKLAADTLLYYTKELWATNFDTSISNNDGVLLNAYYGDYNIEVDFGDTVKVFKIPCLKVNEDSVFILHENDAIIKGPQLLSTELITDNSLQLVFDK
ncbi:endo-1,4-beta-xylanase, partial [Bacteroidota bacterium]